MADPNAGYMPVPVYQRGGMAGAGYGMGPFAAMYTKDPRQALAYQLMTQGTSTAPVQSITQGFGRLAQALAGTFIDQKMRQEYGNRNNRYSETLQKALGQMQPQTNLPGPNPDGSAGYSLPGDRQAAIQTLAANPDTAPYAMGMVGLGAKAETFGSPVKAMGADGKPVYVQVGSNGTVRPLQGFTPPEQQINPTAPMQNFQFRQQLVKQYGEGSPQVAQYDAMVRAPQYQNLGGTVGVFNPVTPAAGPVQNVAKTLPPEQTPEVKGQQTTATKTAEADVQRQNLRPKAEAALADLGRQTELVGSTIDKAVKLISPWSTGYGNWMAALPNTDARELNNLLQTIKANVGFDTLTRMRQASPTGGALGAVSEMENRLLQAVNGALDPMQSGQLKENLQNIKTLYNAVLKEKQAAFAKDYPSGNAPSPGSPPAATPVEDPLGIR